MTKKELRAHFRALRASLSEERRKEAADAAFELLIEELRPFKLVSSFESMLGEIDLQRVNDVLRREGRLVLPSDALQKQVDCFLVPGLAFHISGHRLGYGKGFYDRLLAKTSALTWGIGFKEQEAQALPHEPHDIPLKRLYLF